MYDVVNGAHIVLLLVFVISNFFMMIEGKVRGGFVEAR